MPIEAIDYYHTVSIIKNFQLLLDSLYILEILIVLKKLNLFKVSYINLIATFIILEIL